MLLTTVPSDLQINFIRFFQPARTIGIITPKAQFYLMFTDRH